MLLGAAHAGRDARCLRTPAGGGSVLKESATRSGIIVSALFATSAVLGFVREAVLAAYFGVSAEYDALLVALIIPMFFLTMLGEASMGAAVVPVFITYVEPQSAREKRRIVGSAYLMLSLVLGTVTTVGIVFAPQLARLFAPGFSGSQLELTTGLMRIMLPTVLIVGLSNLVTGLLHSIRSFTAAAATGVVLNLSIVLVTIPLADRIGIAAAALGVLIGSLFQLAIMVPPLIKAGLFPAVGTSFRNPALVRMWKLFWPILAGALIVTALQTIDKMVGSFLPEGSISALAFAKKIAGGPTGIFTMALAVVLFPALVKKVAEGASDRGDLVVRGMTAAAFVTLPWAGIFIALRTPVTAMLLQRGAFDATATSMVALPLAIYCLGEFANGISTMVNNAFYSHHDSKLPMYIYIGANVFRISAMLVMVPALGYLAIAVGHAVAINLQLVVLLLVLRRRHIADLDLRRLALKLARIAAASVVAGLVSAVVYPPLASVLPPTFLGAVAAFLLCLVPVLAAYYLFARLIGCEEATEFRDRILALLKGSRRPPGKAPKKV